MLLEWEVLDTTGVEWDVQDGLVVSWLVQQGPVEITGSGGGGLTAEQVRDLIAAFIAGGANVTVTHNDAGDTLTIAVASAPPSGGAGGALSGSYPNPGLNEESVQDLVAGFIEAGDGVTVTYDDTVGTLTLAATAVTTYYEDSIAVQPWLQTDADLGASATVNAAAHVTRTATWWVQATLTFASYVDVVTPGTGQPRFLIREVFQSLSEDFNGWYWGWSSPNIRASVHGQIGGLPFVGFVDRDGYILDADGNALTRVLQTGDHLIGTVTGVFQND